MFSSTNHPRWLGLLFLFLAAIACSIPAQDGGKPDSELTRAAAVAGAKLNPPTLTPLPPTPLPAATVPPTSAATPSPTPMPTENPATPTPVLEPQPHMVTGIAWEDADLDGLRGENEPVMAGVGVKLMVFEVVDSYDPATGAYNHLNAFTRATAETFTDETGAYQFTLPAEALQLNYPHYVLFSFLDGYTFTTGNLDPADLLDSDVKSSEGETETFSPQIAAAIQMDAGYIDARSSAFVTGDPGAGGDLPQFYLFSDTQADAVFCGNNAPVPDTQVDMTNHIVTVSDDTMTIQVNMSAPITDTFSFAVAPFLFVTDTVTHAYLWETHDNEMRIGPLDPNTFELAPELDPVGTITFDENRGQFLFVIPRSVQPAGFDFVAFRSFHSPTPEDETRCDVAGPFELPPLWQQE